MALFKKNTSGTTLPEEVQQFYEAERRDRPWLAWVLAFASLLVVILVASGLFFGGRWAVRKIRGGTPAQVTTIKTSPTDAAPSPSPTPSGGTTPPTSTSPNTNPSTTPPIKTTPTPPPPATKPTPPPTPPVQKPVATTVTPKTSPTAGTTKLTDTGPQGVLAAFIGTTVLAYAVHFRLSRRSIRG